MLVYEILNRLAEMFSEDENNDDNFIVVNKKPKYATIQTPLFNTLCKLKKENHLLLRGLIVDRTSNVANENVFYIRLNNPKNELFEPDFQFKECHLTINEFYEKNQFGLTASHYTETYTKKSSEAVIEQITVHVYFTLQGGIRDIQANIYNNHTNSGHKIKLDLTQSERGLIYENVKQPLILVKRLIEENYRLYTQAVTDYK
jgi:hypothetical protein